MLCHFSLVLYKVFNLFYTRSDVQTKEEIELLITVLEKDLNELNEKREQIQKRITELNHQRQLLIQSKPF